jgi:hypothetical protein
MTMKHRGGIKRGVSADWLAGYVTGLAGTLGGVVAAYLMWG